MATPTHQQNNVQQDYVQQHVHTYTLWQHMAEKSMWGGSVQRTQEKLLGIFRRADFVDNTGGTMNKQYMMANLVLPHSMMAFNCIHEILSNAADHAIRTWKDITPARASPLNSVSKIAVQFDVNTGIITVYNNGPGMPIDVNPDESAKRGREVRDVEVLADVPLSGTQIANTADRVTGGTNGLGLKLTNVSSTHMSVETVSKPTCSKAGISKAGISKAGWMYFSQKYKRGAPGNPESNYPDAPICAPVTVSGIGGDGAHEPHTTISFRLNWARCFYGESQSGQIADISEATEIDAWIRFQCSITAAYLGGALGNRVEVVYNNEPIPFTSASKLASLIGGPSSVCTSAPVKGKRVTKTAPMAEQIAYKQPWDLAVIVDTNEADNTAGAIRNRAADIISPWGDAHPERPKQYVPVSTGHGSRKHTLSVLATVNGLQTDSGGHIDHVRRRITDEIDAKLKKLRGAKGTKAAPSSISTTDAWKRASLVLCATVPGAEWTSQRKEKLSLGKKVAELYQMDDKFVRDIADTLIQSIVTTGDKKQNTKKKIQCDKYEGAPALRNGRSKSPCWLLIAEGDSAMPMCRSIVSMAEDLPTMFPEHPSLAGAAAMSDFIGLFSIQGVPLNSQRQVKEIEMDDGNVFSVTSEKLRENKRLESLRQIMGLEYGKHYTSPHEMATLRYAYVVLVVDQDLDGSGKIDPLVLVYFRTFWPELLIEKRMMRFMTPLIRTKSTTPKLHPELKKEFYFEESFERWHSTLTHEQDQKLHKPPKYTKGLAGHDPKEHVPSIVRDFYLRRGLFVYDPQGMPSVDFSSGRVAWGESKHPGIDLLRLMYGDDPTPRKEMLRRPIREITDSEFQVMIANSTMQLSTHIEAEAGAYKADATRRQLISLDGLTPSQRKVFTAALKRAKNKNSTIKVFQFGGYVSEKMAYAHGDASLNGTIIGMTQTFLGAKQFPLLLGSGEFGTRMNGGDDAGQPRYIDVRANVDLGHVLYRFNGDAAALNYVSVEGERAEPLCYYPIVPALFESRHNPSEGWSFNMVARDMSSLIEIARKFASGNEAETNMVNTGQITADVTPLPVKVHGFTGEFRGSRTSISKIFSFGSYHYIDASGKPTEPAQAQQAPAQQAPAQQAPAQQAPAQPIAGVRITELPLRTYTKAFAAKLEKKIKDKLKIDDVDVIVARKNETSDIAVWLNATQLQALADKCTRSKNAGTLGDAIQDSLNLVGSHTEFLNFTMPEGGVMEFQTVWNVAAEQLARRRDMYRHVLERDLAVCWARTLLHVQQLRYMVCRTLAKKMKAGLSEEQARAQVIGIDLFVNPDKLGCPIAPAPVSAPVPAPVPVPACCWTKCAAMRSTWLGCLDVVPWDGVAGIKNEKDAEAALVDRNFPALASGNIKAPELRSLYWVLESMGFQPQMIEGARRDQFSDRSDHSHGYILGIKERAMLEDSVRDLVGKIERDRETAIGLVDCLGLGNGPSEQPFPGASMWLAELDKFETLYNKAIAASKGGPLGPAWKAIANKT